jgi:2,3-dihydroxybenzoate-AMP ligase
MSVVGRARVDGVVLPPAEVMRAYEAAGWWTDELLDEFVLRHAAATPDAVAVRSPGSTVTHGQLAELVRGLASNLEALGLQPDDRVVVQLPNQLELVVLVLALVRLGAPPVLAVPALGPREIRHVVETTGAVALAVDVRSKHQATYLAVRDLCGLCPSLRRLLVVGRATHSANEAEVDLEELMGPPAAPRPGDRAADPPPGGGRASVRNAGAVALYLLSSGTTGLPKPIPRTHYDYVYNLKVSSDLTALDSRSVYLPALPAAHNFGLGCPGVLGALSCGGSIVLRRGVDIEGMLGAICEEGVTVAAAVPSTAMQWVNHLRAGSGAAPASRSLRVLQVGGARLQPSNAHELMDTLECQVQQVYGMAEGQLNFTRLDDPVDTVAETQGRPASTGDEWRLVDDEGVDVANGEPGELLVRGPYTIRGYLADTATNDASFTGDGYYRTGDVVRWHETGNLVVEGRRRDFINRGGEKISAEEIEALLAAHEDVMVSAAVAMPSQAFGEEVCVYVVPRSDARLDLRAVRGYLRNLGIARFKLPTHVEVVERLPLTAVGKIDRAALRCRVAELVAK